VAVGTFIKKVAGDQIFHFKAHAGYIVLISDDDPLQDVLFTVSPVDHSGKVIIFHSLVSCLTLGVLNYGKGCRSGLYIDPTGHF